MPSDFDWHDLCVQWVKEYVAKAEARKKDGKASIYAVKAYTKALDALVSFNEPVYDITELTKLHGIGDKTVSMLKKASEKYAKSNNMLNSPIASPTKRLNKVASEILSSESSSLMSQSQSLSSDVGSVYVLKNSSKRKQQFDLPVSRQNQKSRRVYVPKYNSTAFYVLTSLYELDSKTSFPGIGKDELIRTIKSKCTSGLGNTLGKNNSGLSPALNTLMNNELVYYHDGLVFLEDRGRMLAQKLLNINSKNSRRLGFPTTDAEPVPSNMHAHTPTGTRTPVGTTTSMGSSRSFFGAPVGTPFGRYTGEFTGTNIQTETWKEGSFSIKLVLDNREIASVSDRHGIKNDLRNLNIDVLLESLSVGDCTWVAEHQSGRRAILHYIVERKTLNDLRASIHDGRYHDQKSRLQQCGLKTIFYLIEYPNSVANNMLFNEHRAKLNTSLSQTLVRHNFHLKITRSQIETVKFLAQITKKLQQKYCKQLTVAFPTSQQYSQLNLQSTNFDAISFSSFQHALAKSKQKTVGETLRLMLRTIRGVSAEKAEVIQQIYPTPYALANCTKEELIEKTQNLVRRQQISAKLAEVVCDIWSKASR